VRRGGAGLGEAGWCEGEGWGGGASLVVAPLLLDVRLGSEELLAQHLERQMDTIYEQVECR
jgi:hypothetical protein